MAEVLGFNHLSLSVTDLGASRQWYQQVLGLDLVAEMERDTFSRARLRSPNGAVTLTLTCHVQRESESFSERRPGLDHLAFSVGSVEDVAILKDRFTSLGVRHSEVSSRSSGTAAITLRDPDNIQLEVFGSSPEIDS